MIDKNKWQLLLTYVENGMILDNPNYKIPKDDEDENTGGKFDIVIEMSEKDSDDDESLAESKLLKRLMFSLIDYFGLHKTVSDHSQYNIDIKVIEVETGEEVKE